MKVKLIIKQKAEEMYLELLERKQSVVLIPAPDQRHTNHMIRVAEEQPPEWFSEFVNKYPRIASDKKYTKFRSRINRKSVLAALQRIKNNDLRTENAKRLHRFIINMLDEEIPF